MIAKIEVQRGLERVAHRTPTRRRKQLDHQSRCVRVVLFDQRALRDL
jgi:hypothetical protein